MATYSPFNRIFEQTFNNVSGSGSVVYTTTKRALISGKILNGSSIANDIHVYFSEGNRDNSIIYYNEDVISGKYAVGSAVVPAGTQIKIETSGNFISFTLTVIEID